MFGSRRIVHCGPGGPRGSQGNHVDQPRESQSKRKFCVEVLSVRLVNAFVAPKGSTATAEAVPMLPARLDFRISGLAASLSRIQRQVAATAAR
jgi:hypothetical protein